MQHRPSDPVRGPYGARARPAATVRRLATLGASTLVALVVALGPGAAAAGAHDALVGSDPPDGAVLTQVPTQVVLTFAATQLEEGAFVEVIGPDGSPWSDGEAVVAGASVTQALAAGMPAGAYTVQWRSVAGDGHPVSGVLAFSLDLPVAEPTAEPTAPASTDATASAQVATPTPQTASPRTPSPETGDEANRLRPSATSWLLAGTFVVAAAVVTGLLVQRRAGVGR